MVLQAWYQSILFCLPRGAWYLVMSTYYLIPPICQFFTLTIFHIISKFPYILQVYWGYTHIFYILDHVSLHLINVNMIQSNMKINESRVLLLNQRTLFMGIVLWVFLINQVHHYWWTTLLWTKLSIELFQFLYILSVQGRCEYIV